MKTLRLVSFITLVFMFLAVVRCSDSESDPVALGDLTGTVTYTNAAGASTPAAGAFVTLLAGTSEVIQVVTNATGNYIVPSLAAGSYTISASYYTEPTNTGGRLNGLIFETESDVAVTMASADLAQNLTLVNAGQAGADLDAVDIDYDWNGSAYTNFGVLAGQNPPLPLPAGKINYDPSHSPINFEFAYRGKEADFNGSFAQLRKCKINFSTANPTAGTIDVTVDLASFDTRARGGRDPRTTIADTPTFNPLTQFTEYGCVINGTFGVITDSGTTPTEGTPQLITNNSRYVSFTSTSIAKLGDGYVAKGNMVFQGPKPGMSPAIVTSVPIEMWFKQVPCWTNTGATPNRRYWSLEGKFLMDAKNKWGITNGSLNDAIVRMQISIVGYVDL